MARPVTGGRFGRVGAAAVDSLPQVGQLGGQSGELGPELLVLLPENLDLLLQRPGQRPDARCCRLPICF
jgi:hypothetical protein